MNDHMSHTFASTQGWSYVPSAEEFFFYNELDVKALMNRGKNQPSPQPVKRPWEQPRENAPVRQDPEHQARLERLQMRLGIPAT